MNRSLVVGPTHPARHSWTWEFYCYTSVHQVENHDSCTSMQHVNSLFPDMVFKERMPWGAVNRPWKCISTMILPAATSDATSQAIHSDWLCSLRRSLLWKYAQHPNEDVARSARRAVFRHCGDTPEAATMLQESLEPWPTRSESSQVLVIWF